MRVVWSSENPALYGAPFWCYISGESCFRAKRPVSNLSGEPFWKMVLFSKVELFFSKLDYEGKNGCPLEKIADFQKNNMLQV